jgi:hypothetical protein
MPRPEPLCARCHKPRAIFIEDGERRCRNCVVIPDEHRAALNALMQAGLIYGK